jgi:dCMP deaminase
MCRRQVINSGLSRVVIRRTETDFEVVEVEEWIRNDDSLPAFANEL